MKLILIEGTDGAGKSTISKALLERLDGMGLKAHYTHFPNYDYYTGDFIKKCLFGELGDFTMVNPYIVNAMYAIDRYVWFLKHGEEYKDHIVIVDRYTMSSQVYQSTCMAYQLIGKEKITAYHDNGVQFKYLLNDTRLHNYRDWVANYEFDKIGLPKPDLTIWIKATDEDIEKRKAERADATEVAKDNYEADEIFSKCTSTIGELLAKNDPDTITIDNSYGKKISDIVDEIMTNIEHKLTFDLSYLK